VSNTVHGRFAIVTQGANLNAANHTSQSEESLYAMAELPHSDVPGKIFQFNVPGRKSQDLKGEHHHDI
jgi:hypothetical protein